MTASISTTAFDDVDSDQDNEAVIDLESNSDCLSASDSIDSNYSDTTDLFSTDSDIDPEYLTFPASFEKADNICVGLNELVQASRIPRDKIFYKYLNSVTLAMIDPSHDFDEEVVEFFNSIKFLGGERTVNFVRGPMWHGCGRGRVQDPQQAKPNLGGPSQTTRSKCSSGYTTKSGAVKPCHHCVKLAASSEHVLEKEATVICNSYCDTCIAMKTVCGECKELGHSSHIPSLRACRRCLETNQRCLRVALLVVATDCESGNKRPLN